MWNCRSSRLLLALWLLTTVLPGCGHTEANTGIVRGRITFAGKPVSDGSIRFESKERVSQNADLDAEGNYHVQTYESLGLPPGVYRVAVMPRVVTSNQPLLAAPPEDTKLPDFPHIPPKFRDVATSQLSIKVERGANPPFDFDLSK